jgi:hypothetical protein
MGHLMKTTIELPDALFRRAKSLAASEGKSLKELFTEAVFDRLRRSSSATSPKPWESAFGGLRDLHRETKRIEQIIAAEFETIDEDEWR